MYNQIKFKKLILELDNGESFEVDGAYITQMDLERNLENILFDRRFSTYRVKSPDILTIKFEIWGNSVWEAAKDRASRSTPALPEPPKQLSEHQE